MARITINTKSIDRFLAALEKKGSPASLKKDVAKWLEASGMEFLDEVQNEIIRLQVVDTRRMLNSFNKGGDGNIWQVSNGGLTLLVGTNVEYAQYVNDGHRQKTRWVPGFWSGDTFTYDAGANSGMLLKAKYIEGKPYWDNAVAIFERMFTISFERKLQEWADQLGGDY